MRRYLLRRLAQGAAVLFVVSAVVFAIVHAAPGGPALLNNPDVDPKMAKEMEKQLGLDDPIPVQYARWLGNAVRGNLGRSYQHSLGTAELLWARIPNTLLLSGTALRPRGGPRRSARHDLGRVPVLLRSTTRRRSPRSSACRSRSSGWPSCSSSCSRSRSAGCPRRGCSRWACPFSLARPAPAPDHAEHRARHVPAGPAHALRPLEHGGRPRPGLRAHGPRQGAPRARRCWGATRSGTR